MSYEKMIRWNKKRPKGTKQPIIFSTNSGFWPSGSFIEKWAEYVAECKKKGIVYLDCESYYRSQLG